MNKIRIIVGAAVLALVLAGCDVTPGGRCSAEGSKATNKNGVSYTCAKLLPTDRLVWQQDAPLTPDRP